MFHFQLRLEYECIEDKQANCHVNGFVLQGQHPVVSIIMLQAYIPIQTKINIFIHTSIQMYY